jgi:hypothetical protein
MRRIGGRSCPISLLLGALALVLSIAGISVRPARAQTLIDPSQNIGAVPSFGGAGLDGLYYYFPNNQMATLADAASLVAGAGGATGTFSTTNICFPDCLGSGTFPTGSAGFMAFTNGNASNITGESPTGSFAQTVLRISGYLAIPTAGTYTFNINSDDGSDLTIGNLSITDDGIHGQQTASETITFGAAGLYAIALDYFQNNGGAGFDLTATDPSNNCFLGCPTAGGGAEPNSLFYSASQIEGAPAPEIGGGMASFACLAVFGAGNLIRRRRRQGLA